MDVRERLAIPAQQVTKQPASERVKNWDEVFPGFSADAARVEAARCIHCPSAPCQAACPVQNDIPAALSRIEQGDILGAAAVFRRTSELPDVCGRVCPQEKLCEGECVVSFALHPGPAQPAVAIGKLEAFVADHERMQGANLPLPIVQCTGRRVAIVGAGPAGIAAAERLVRLGHACTIFDSAAEPGGVLTSGIPSFKLNPEIVKAKIGVLRRLGVVFVSETRLGQDVTVDGLLTEYGFNAVFLATGAPLGARLAIPGEGLSGVYQASEYLTATKRSERGRRVVVIGGGDTSMDCVRTAVRRGAVGVTCLYRRDKAAMPGRREERLHAEEEGVRFRFLTAPLELRGDGQGHVRAVFCQEMRLSDRDASGRQSAVPVARSQFEFEADTVVIAVGYRPDLSTLRQSDGLKTDHLGRILVDRATHSTSLRAVFAGGDSVNGADLVVTAMADGQRAAAAIDQYLSTLS